MIARWTIGFVAGTAVIWLTSPLFVRSYLPREINRGVLTLPAGESYRWRSEGYATSKIGDLGMVGHHPVAKVAKTFGTSIPTSIVTAPKVTASIVTAPKVLATSATLPSVVALWGDSQAEGVCVDDEQKIFSLANDQVAGQASVIPLARSGDTAGDWLQQIPFAEKELGVSAHLFLITELSDLAFAADPILKTAELPKTNAVVSWLPDFAIHAARNVLTQDDGVTPRRLRFNVGVQALAATPKIDQQPNRLKPRLQQWSQSTDWNKALRSIKQTTDQPVAIVYAPQLPRVMGNKIIFADNEQESFTRLKLAAKSEQIPVIDLRDRLRESAQQNRWPHGFHNGRIGSGHLNVTGNQIVAEAIISILQNQNR
ncbi:hypothetical protein LF1_42770 [Rubripirellula obstinata]|uniref:Uncharacterized protein n=1 Tax=Rubripirellula obstinata TaxID=406547 RepID=A0A5B1CMY3_9BACT|nr:hypothetical protein [Rubripirellula obstinata]KAA1261722.1 hypothetical protein LF1_42770 [Rubripirellula obstinata]